MTYFQQSLETCQCHMQNKESRQYDSSLFNLLHTTLENLFIISHHIHIVTVYM